MARRPEALAQRKHPPADDVEQAVVSVRAAYQHGRADPLINRAVSFGLTKDIELHIANGSTDGVPRLVAEATRVDVDVRRIRLNRGPTAGPLSDDP